MGKKKGKKGGSFADVLVVQLRLGDPGELASRAEQQNLTPEQFEQAFGKAAELLQKGPDPREVVGLPPAFQVAFLQLAESEEDDDQINDILSMSTDKEVKKEAKRVLHRLRSRGLNVSMAEEAGSSILDRQVETSDPPLPCYLTPITGSGSRMIWLASYVRGGVAVYQAECNDQDGLTEFAGGVIGRSRYRSLIKEVLGSEKVALLEIPYAEARKLIGIAVDQTREAARSLPESYLEASSNLPEAGEPEPAPDPRALFPPESVDSADLLRKSSELHELPAFVDWTPDEEILRVFHEKLREVETGQVAINQQQRVDQVAKALDDAVGSLLDEEDKRTRYQQRLFEMAAFLVRTDQPEPAKLATAAAWQLSAEDFKPLDSPFFDRLVKKMFKSPEEIVKQMGEQAKDTPPEEPPADPGNLIVTP
jgi:hypothetical protein